MAQTKTAPKNQSASKNTAAQSSTKSNAKADADSKPALATGGSLVSTQYYEKLGNEIAPHMYNFGLNSGVQLVNPPTITNNPTIDTYDPAVGRYHASTNSGPMPDIVTGVAMPAIPAPPPGLPHVGDVSFAKNGSTLINASFSADDFHVRNRHQIVIQGDVTIVSNGLFTVENNSDIILEPDAHLTLFILDDIHLENHIHINDNTGNHEQCTIYYAGTAPFEMVNNLHVYASLVAPNAELTIGNNADFYGTVTADGLSMSNNSGLHIAGVGAGGACAAIADVEGAMGAANDGNISGALNFAQWFRTIPGVNASGTIPMTFFDDGTGVLEFDDSDFTPIDDEFYGNEGQPANRNFTLQVDAKFKYDSCQGHFFEFYGDGDVWLYIDDKLVIDLAGPQEGGHQYIDVDRLGLVANTSYNLRFFYAQRVADGSPFRIRTNLPLESAYTGSAPTMAFYD